ncbi:twin-arginine translocase subunit TatC [Marisediminicola senii]|uniref:twin-arginine translocase subunit TatC n=1 Tax=Marisediminicola senii TaxID=2711233 RepID=UPI0013EA5AAC|nr:twin-arginine translocase subunit TatC [Marisediminicola senii]
MSLGAHLIELRKRLFRALLGVLIGGIVGFITAEYVLDLLRAPIVEIAASRNASLNYDTVTGAFDLRMQMALYIGLVVSSPVWLYQIFAYIVPALSRREKRYTFGFFFSAVPLFLAGCAAGFYVFPHIVELLAGFAPPEDTSIFQSKYYFDFAMKLVFAVGIAFVLPVFVVLLNFLGVISAKGILMGWRWAILAITVFCAIATPAADVYSMFLLAIPMVVLYFIAAGIAWVHDRVAARRAERFLADEMGSAPV